MTDSGFLDDLTQVDLNTATPLLCGLHLYLHLFLRFLFSKMPCDLRIGVILSPLQWLDNRGRQL